METSDKIITDLTLKGFEVHEDFIPTFDGFINFQVTVRHIVKKGKRYTMAENITTDRLTKTICQYILYSRRHMLEQIVKKNDRRRRIVGIE